MPITLGKVQSEHEMIVGEVYQSNGGVYAIYFHCKTCDKGKSFGSPEYSKYRLALAAAQDAASDHAGGVDTTPWHLLD